MTRKFSCAHSTTMSGEVSDSLQCRNTREYLEFDMLERDFEDVEFE